MYAAKTSDIPSGRHYRVLVDGSPLLEGMPVERAPFAQYFEAAPDEDVIVFPNLGGVGWLHIRLDSRPKYYSYGPYRRSP